MTARGSLHWFPVVLCEVGDGASVDALREMFQLLRSAAPRGRHVVVTDSTGARSMPDARTRRYIADEQAACEAVTGHLVLASIVIVDSAVARGALKAIEWLRPTRVPQHFVATRGEALALAIEELSRQRIAVSDELRSLASHAKAQPGLRLPLTATRREVG